MEEAWILPQLNDLCSKVEGLNPKNSPIEFMRRLFSGSSIYLRVVGQFNTMGVTFDTDDKQKEIIRNTRISIYRLYGLFDKINSQSKDGVRLDKNLSEKITSGQLLANDQRFEAFRSRSEGDSYEYERITLNESDNFWLKSSHLALFLEIEFRLLFELRAEVKSRVEERARGTQAILSLGIDT